MLYTTITLLVLVGVVAAVPTFAPIESVTVPDEEWCKAGYFWDFTDTNDCCSYYQCAQDRQGLIAYKRWCVEPLIWNNITCACDYQDMTTIDDCKNPPETCWEPYTQPKCQVDTGRAEFQCCQIGESLAAANGSGYLFEINQEDPSNYTFCPGSDTEAPGRCPNITDPDTGISAAGLFELDTCCCQKVPTDCGYFDWEFSDGAESPFIDVECNAPMEPNDCIINAGLYCPNSNGSTAAVFSKFFFGNSFTVADIFSCPDGPCDGVLFDNGNLDDAKTPVDPTLTCSTSSDTVTCTILGLDDPIEVSYNQNTGENEVVVTVTPLGVTLGVNTESPLFTPRTALPITGTKCPLSVGDLGEGRTNDFLVFPRNSLSKEDVTEFRSSGTLPDDF